MVIFVERIGETHTGQPFSWRADDAMLYAVAVGAGLTDSGLRFTTDDSTNVPMATLPLFCVILSNLVGSSSIDLAGDFDLNKVLHVGQRVDIHSTVATAGTAYGERAVSAIYDTGRHAIIELSTSLHDVTGCGQVFATVTTTILVRGEGGFGGAAPARSVWQPTAAPTASYEYQTRADQALLYRLTGDRNPLHSDPVQASRAGFARPILHGLATLGIAAQQLQIATAEGREVTSVSADFSAPVTPGDILRTDYWQSDDGLRFLVYVGDRLVVSNGELVYARS